MNDKIKQENSKKKKNIHSGINHEKLDSPNNLNLVYSIFFFPGFSDPFCELLLGKKKVFKTTVKKKTLFPIWNESVTLELPDDSNATVELVST